MLIGVGNRSTESIILRFERMKSTDASFTSARSGDVNSHMFRVNIFKTYCKKETYVLVYEFFNSRKIN